MLLFFVESLKLASTILRSLKPCLHQANFDRPTDKWVELLGIGQNHPSNHSDNQVETTSNCLTKSSLFFHFCMNHLTVLTKLLYVIVAWRVQTVTYRAIAFLIRLKVYFQSSTLIRIVNISGGEKIAMKPILSRASNCFLREELGLANFIWITSNK